MFSNNVPLEIIPAGETLWEYFHTDKRNTTTLTLMDSGSHVQEEKDAKGSAITKDFEQEGTYLSKQEQVVRMNTDRNLMTNKGW